jgi:uncharacterized UPF0160 family protein
MNILQKITSCFKKPLVLITHSSGFHADDVMACAILKYHFESIGQPVRIIRSRDPKVIEKGDIVFDVGAIYDESTNRFDHHQTGGAGKRDNGIPYASVGLVWKKFGPIICEPCNSIVDKIDRELIQLIDANDNGCDFSDKHTEVYQLPLSTFFMVYNTTWKEQLTCSDDNNDARFFYAVKLAQDFFTRYLKVCKENIEAAEKIKKVYNDASDKKILIFDQNFTRPVFIANLVNFPEPLLHIYPDRSGTWSIETVPASFGSFEKRINFPAAWAGLYKEELQKVSGFPDLEFCHNGRFLCKSKTKETAMKVAEYVINQG